MKLKALGIQLVIDDFGTGYSSLSYLHCFPFDSLKVDRSFVNVLDKPGQNAEIVQAIVTLAHTLHMDVVAEGIETAQQLVQLKMLHCAQGQGFYFSPALEADQAETLLASQRDLADLTNVRM